MATAEKSFYIADKVIRIIREEGDLDGDDVLLESDLRDDLGLDSVDTVHILFGLETEFNLEIPEEDIETVKRVSDIVEYIWSRIDEAGGVTQQTTAVEVPAS